MWSLKSPQLRFLVHIMRSYDRNVNKVLNKWAKTINERHESWKLDRGKETNINGGELWKWEKAHDVLVVN